MIEVEICTPSLASARAAKEGGASRIELCSDLSCGGLTPPIEEVEYCVQRLGLRTHVLVRPRPGDFCYSPAEMAEMERTVVRCRQAGAAAIVVGCLTAEGLVDVAATRRLVALAEGMEVTFHRAFDEARQAPLEALRAVEACGCQRLLTSGQRATAMEGADVIAQLVGSTGVRILAGSGVTAANVRQLVELTGVGEVHGSCKTTLADGTVQTDAEQVRQLIEQVGLCRPAPCAK